MAHGFLSGVQTGKINHLKLKLFHSNFHISITFRKIHSTATRNQVYIDLNRRGAGSAQSTPGMWIDNLYPLYLCIFTKARAGRGEEVISTAVFFIFGNNVCPGVWSSAPTVRHLITKCDVFDFSPALPRPGWTEIVKYFRRTWNFTVRHCTTTNLHIKFSPTQRHNWLQKAKN